MESTAIREKRLYADDVEGRFWPKVDKQEDDCWLWTARTVDGYGTFWMGYAIGHKKAHRLAYELLVGEIPVGLELDHLCRVRNCVNPAHLEPVTHRENARRGNGCSARFYDVTHCVHGHEFTTENTYIRGDGGRFCRQCGRRRYKEYMARKRAAQ